MKNSASQQTKHTAKIVMLLVAIGVVSLLLGMYFGIRFTRELYQKPPSRTRQNDVDAIRGWMTLEYVARAYGTPEPELEKALHIEHKKYQRSSLSQVAQDIQQSEEELLDKIKKTIREFQTAHPTPPPR